MFAKFPDEVFRARPTGDPEHAGQTLSQMAWDCLRIRLEDLDKVAGEREVWASLPRLPQVSGRRFRNRWIIADSSLFLAVLPLNHRKKPHLLLLI